MIKQLKRKYQTLLYGEYIGKAPNGEKMYVVKDSKLHKLPSVKYRALQENQNYISYLGITKTNLIGTHKYIDEQANKIKNNIALAQLINQKGTMQNELTETLTQIKEIAENLAQATLTYPAQINEFDRANEAFIVNTFDMFFFFEGEDPFNRNEQTVEKKKQFLIQYPQLVGFFLQKHMKNQTELSSLFKENTRFAIAQATVMLIAKQIKEELTHLNTPNSNNT